MNGEPELSREKVLRATVRVIEPVEPCAKTDALPASQRRLKLHTALRLYYLIRETRNVRPQRRDLKRRDDTTRGVCIRKVRVP